MNATETRYANLNKMTVKELGQILHQMGAKGWSGMRKAGMIDVIMLQIDLDQSEAIRMNEEMFSLEEDEFMFAGILWSGKIAKMLRFNDTAVKRYNPTTKRGKDGVVILTAKQKRRINKKARHFGKTIGFWEVSA